jgi:hypothetical protein
MEAGLAFAGGGKNSPYKSAAMSIAEGDGGPRVSARRLVIKHLTFLPLQPTSSA